MAEKSEKQLVVGILAHVDSGKTTLSEAMLYRAGSIRRLGRVDNKDAFLDTDTLEKARGITIFSKQALLKTGRTGITLLDTPGHVDFSTETERTLQVLDYAVLVVSGRKHGLFPLRHSAGIHHLQIRPPSGRCGRPRCRPER